MPTAETPPSDLDRDILERYKSGQITRDELFWDLFERYFASLVAAGRRMGLSVEESRDLSQDAFVRVYQFLNDLDASRSISALLMTTFRNLAFNRFRSLHAGKRAGVVVPEDELLSLPAAGPSAEERAISSEELERVRVAFNEALAPDEAALLLAFYVEERSLSEIAEAQGVSLSTMHFRLQTARRKLSRYLMAVQPRGGADSGERE